MKARNWDLKGTEIWSENPQITGMDWDVLLQYGRELEILVLKLFFHKQSHNSNVAGKFITYNWPQMNV